MAAPSVSVIIPTYREVENLPLLIQRIDAVRTQAGLTLELLIMDDDSRDGSAELLAGMNLPWVKLVVRTGSRGLSLAVLDGMKLARYDVLLVMDADLSHPPEKIPEMLDVLGGGADFVVGSRYVAQGRTDADWGLFRWVNSKVATLLARPFTDIKDPMSGFFALRRETFAGADRLDPIGYKIALELLVKCRCRDVREVPIFFAERRLGQSKLSLREQFRYLRHVGRLMAYRLFRV